MTITITIRIQHDVLSRRVLTYPTHTTHTLSLPLVVIYNTLKGNNPVQPISSILFRPPLASNARIKSLPPHTRARAYRDLPRLYLCAYVRASVELHPILCSGDAPDR